MSASANTIKPRNKGTKVLFNNPLLERLSRTNTAIPVSYFSYHSPTFLMIWGYIHSEYSALGTNRGVFITEAYYYSAWWNTWFTDMYFI